MRHIRVFSKPIGRFHDAATLTVTNDTRRLPELRLRILPFLRIQFLSVCIVGFPLVVHEKVDTGGKKVHGRSLKELVTASASLFLAFLQGFQQGFRRFARRRKIIDVLCLNGVHPFAVLHIHEVDDVELASFWHFAELLVFFVMIVKFSGKCRKFVVIDHHRKALGTMLADERFYDAERLTAARSSDYPCSSETVAYRHPSLAKFTFVIVPHRYIHAILVLILLFALLETFILEVKPVFTQSLLDELRDVIQCDMHQYHTDQRSRHIEDDVQRQGVEPRFHRMMVQPHGEHNQEQSADKWI